MDRKEIIQSPDYWVADIQLALYDCAARFMKDKGMNRSQLAEYLGVSKGYVSQLLNGDYDHRLSKMAELSLAFGYVPKLDFMPVEDYIRMEESRVRLDTVSWRSAEFEPAGKCKTIELRISEDEYSGGDDNHGKEVA